MPVNIAPSDKRLLTWAAIVVTVLIIAVALLSDEEEESGVPTTYSSQSSGARAAYLLLKETGHHVERWEEAPLQLPKAPEKTTLVLAQPSILADKEEAAALQNFVSRGGRVLITGFLARSFFLAEKSRWSPFVLRNGRNISCSC